ncbi:SET domain-containing protein [Dendrothele bispora CBS 962.96]|uniref:SET domain-containing protein n=1 Tax=Dendrothele bispora (strain CBS 962.96) TaxID=1314807 RepID=A0A4S8LDQ8_DENBC|nr:SET domain-containing protein [Dendrothele bispora CBS 962.96]
MSASDLDSLPQTLRLKSHPSARDRCTSAVTFSPGTILLSVPALVTVLLPAQKGHRCDACNRQPQNQSLKRCTGCASYWYCDTICQNVHWKTQHRKMCKDYNLYYASSRFQNLQAHERMDALLLSTLCARMSQLELGRDSSISTFLSLLPGPIEIDPPSICGRYSISADQIKSLYSRFGNNNFSMHSHFNVFGHGIFPLASRLFNHSCMPNAAVKYILSPSQLVRMEIVALRQIMPDEEICIPYIDPALLQTRAQIFELTYGFNCNCTSCTFLGILGRIPDPPKNDPELQNLTNMLEEFVRNMGEISVLQTGQSRGFPSQLLCVFHETFLGDLSEKFSASSHEGPYDIALKAGTTLTALYRLIYPSNYPQIGIHLLEMAKTAWNQWMQANSDDEAPKALALQALTLARGILTVFGSEGDEHNGPLLEIQTLGHLLQRRDRHSGTET